MSKTIAETTIEQPTDPGFKYISREEGIQFLDALAREYLGMSGEEFVRRYHAGEIEDPNRAEVTRVAMAIPFAEP